ncbi:MAG: hypothetical protein M0009_14220 [Deltaproteobacteria bacterium]|nr:hypothetical protein [Deltaproteobacteria bacterium]
MKKRTLLIVLGVAVLWWAAGARSWAYTFTLESQIKDAIGATVYFAGGSHSFGTLQPGETKSYSNSDWYNVGVCWDKLETSRQNINLGACQNIKVIMQYDANYKLRFYTDFGYF